MKKWLQRVLKEEKGLTLIELLAVIVILGIIAAIAVPSITGITNNTRTEAHRANAIQIVEAAKQYVAIQGSSLGFTTALANDGDVDDDATGEAITLQTLITDGYFPTSGIKDPENGDTSYDANDTTVFVVRDGNQYNYYITLERAGTGDHEYLTGVNSENIDTATISPAP